MRQEQTPDSTISSTNNNYPRELLEATTRIRNTIDRHLSNTDHIQASLTGHNGNYHDLETPRFQITITIDVSEEDGLSENPENVVERLLSRTFLYNGSSFEIESQSLEDSTSEMPSHEISGWVSVKQDA